MPQPRRLRRALLLAGLVLAAPGAAAQEACGEHVVAPGDTLTAIARERLGAPDPGPLIELNRDRLPDPDRIRTGLRLSLPCPPGPATPTPPATAAAAAPTPGAGAPPPAAPEPPRALRARPGGDAAASAAAGVAAARLLAALAEAGGADAPKDAALPPLAPAAAMAAMAPGGAWPLSYPWAAPDCTRLARLPRALAERCARLAFSAPLAAAPVVWIARAGAAPAGAQDHAALRGAVICRPAGGFDGDLAALGLAPPRAARLSPADATACLEAVAAGRADVASLPAAAGRAALARRRAAGEGPRLAEIPALASRITLHAAARRDSPEGRAALVALDAGLAALRPREAEREAAGGAAALREP